jgi:hypothetical protein
MRFDIKSRARTKRRTHKSSTRTMTAQARVFAPRDTTPRNDDAPMRCLSPRLLSLNERRNDASPISMNYDLSRTHDRTPQHARAVTLPIHTTRHSGNPTPQTTQDIAEPTRQRHHSLNLGCERKLASQSHSSQATGWNLSKGTSYASGRRTLLNRHRQRRGD